MMGYKYIAIFLALQTLLCLTSCNNKDRQLAVDKEPLPLYCTFNLQRNGAGVSEPNSIQPTRVMVCVVNNEGLVEAQQARKVNSSGDLSFTFNDIPQGSKRLYAYAISPQGDEDDTFEAKNYVLFPFLNSSGVITDFDGAGVSQFAIPRFSHEYQLQDLIAKIEGHTTTDANIIYSGYSEIVHTKGTKDTPKEITLFPLMSRVEVRLFIDQTTKDYWNAEGISVTDASVSFANLSQSCNFFFAKSVPSTMHIDKNQFTSISEPAGVWKCNVPTQTLHNPTLKVYPQGLNDPTSIVAYSAPIFSSLWHLNLESQPKLDLVINLSDGNKLFARFPISTGDNLTSVSGGVDKPLQGDLYPSYNYKLSLIISVMEVTIQYQLVPWDEKTIETEPFV